jgi:anti-sigma regulatory factor (Ser/Thr protein kinase)
MSTPFKQSYPVYSADFKNAGTVSRAIKVILSSLGLNLEKIRKIAIACYEAEVNLIIHSLGGSINLTIDTDFVSIESVADGPGSAHIDLAMTEGYSTASDEIRQLGFGAGMGLPNMKINADQFEIESKIDVGTHITMRFNIS